MIRVGPGAWGATLLAAVSVAVSVIRPRRVVVEGPSMEPTLTTGDRLVVGCLGRVRVGDVVALRHPHQDGHLLVKRIVAVTADGVVVEGDNPAWSTDSRFFGPVDRGALVGRVLYRYAPASRAGRFRRTPAFPGPASEVGVGPIDPGRAIERGTIT